MKKACSELTARKIGNAFVKNLINAFPVLFFFTFGNRLFTARHTLCQGRSFPSATG